MKIWVAKDKHGTYLYRETPLWSEKKRWWYEGKLLCMLSDNLFPEVKENECMEFELKPAVKEPEREYYGN